ncbi:MAG: MauE/DoxX family redox-associated membrane protein [Planctomycetota bacterium]
MSKADVILISASNDETVQQRRLRLAPLRTAADMLVVSAAGVLLFAWFRRLQSGDSLSEIIASHGLIPAAVVTQAAAFVVIGELALAIGALWLVCVQRRTRVAACWLGGTAAVFALYAGLLVLMPPDQPTSCGCGISGDSIADWPLTAIRNSSVAIVLFASAFVAPK